MRFFSVATFAHPEHFGGAERVIATVAEGLAARGHDVTLLTGHADRTPEREERAGVHVIRYELDRRNPLAFYRSVWRGVRAAMDAGAGRDAEVLHLHQSLSGLAALGRWRPSHRPVLTSFYAPYHLEYLARYRQGRDTGAVPLIPRVVGAVLRRGDHRILRWSDEIVVLSRFSRDQVEALDPPSVARTTIAPAGVDLERFRPPADDAERVACRARLDLPDDAPWLLTVRRLVPRMGIEDLLDACAVLAGEGLPFRLAIAGDGEHRGALETHAARLGLADRVRFLGRVRDARLGDLYRAAEVFVLPTRSLEGFGMVTAEALAAGLAVVATDAGATGEVLADVAGARLVPASAPERLADALRGLVADGDARRAAGAAARAHAEAHLGWDGHLDALEAAARRALGRHR